LKLAVIGICAALSFGAAAHGGLSMEKDMCKLRLGPYFMHFTGYQPDGSNEKEFCEDIPATGRTIIVLDDVEHALRELPIEFRIVRDTGTDTVQEADSVVYLAPKVYPTGSVALEHHFDQAGKYVGIVTLGDKERHVSRFPFSVGAGGGGQHWKHAGFVLLVVAAGLLVFMAPRFIGKTKSS
jgi:hypothetical protein